MDWISKEDYILSKYRQFGIKVDGNNWWDNISLLPDQVPECKKCVSDTNKFRKNLIDLNKYEYGKDEKSNSNSYIECCQYCLWWDYFHQKRLDITSRRNKK